MRNLWALFVPAIGMLLAVFALGAEPAAPATSPLAAADAGGIVFSSNRSGPWRIWCIRPDGSGLKQLSPAGGDEHDVDPAISPDGKTILFASTRGGTTGVWRMPRDGGQPVRICDGDQAEWSPDGRQIVFRRQERLMVPDPARGRVQPSPLPSPQEQLVVHDLAAKVQRTISPKSWPHPSGPAWSPDGKQIAAACRFDAGNALYLLPAAGGEPTLVYNGRPACEPHWSPDGKRLVYETETAICTIDPDGKKNRPVTYFGGVQRYGRFSPDGQSIVYCQGESERGPWELFIIPAQGGTPRKLTEGASDMNPDWK